MIESWRLRNFKSVVDFTSLDFAPLTLFTGANSAGKSTVIQSILLTAQTIQSSVYSRPVILNGHIARLGSFRDLVSGGNLSTAIQVGFTLNPCEFVAERDFRAMSNLRRRRSSPLERKILEVSCDYKFSVLGDSGSVAPSELLLLQPFLEELSLSVNADVGANEKPNQKSVGLRIQRSAVSPEKRAEDYKISSEGFLRSELDTLKFEVPTRPILEQRSSRGNIQKDIVGASFVHFLPRTLTTRYDSVEARVTRQFEALSDPLWLYRDSTISDSDAILPDEAAVQITDVLRQITAEVEVRTARQDQVKRKIDEAIELIKSTKDIRQFSRLVRLLGPEGLTRIATSVQPRKQELKTLLRAGQSPHYLLASQQLPDSLQAGADIVQDMFVRYVRYLGPLRDEPKPVYPLSGGTDPADVGFRGEHTAAVLDLHKSTSIEYVPSAAFDQDQPQTNSQSASLGEAVLDWLRYMGVGTNFSTSDLGKLGHELKITTPDSDLEHDLTQVGVGVSQVLPILVLALLSERGSVLVFEQPELHLHPRVQTRLADFFVSMTVLGKQCIVETHSEYLITRLRYRAATAEDDSVSKSVKMYFVEKNGTKSNYRPVSINELGMIEDWPEGFFDESESATASLLKKGLEKRRRKKNGPQ